MGGLKTRYKSQTKRTASDKSFLFILTGYTLFVQKADRMDL